VEEGLLVELRAGLETLKVVLLICGEGNEGGGEHRHHTAQHSTAQHSTAQHSTAQHSTAQRSTAQHSTAWDGAAQHSTAWDGAARRNEGRECSGGRRRARQGGENAPRTFTRGVLVHDEEVRPQPRNDEAEVELTDDLHASEVGLVKDALQLTF
jgi:hypothetical protein